MNSITFNDIEAERCLASTRQCDSEKDQLLVSVLMPCLNEARTVEACIKQACEGCEALISANASRKGIPTQSTGTTASDLEFAYEIIIADNGSNDGSQEIAERAGAKIVSIAQRGYGAALLGGIAAARGKYIVMGDADCSYDFGEIPKFVAKLEEGFDLVMGNRFAGEIKPGAMPWHHRYIGNPVLSGIGRLLYRPGCRDFHCGLRAFDRKKVNALQLGCPGMEFASEMVILASQGNLRISEIPIILYPDRRGRPTHLRSIRDGFRHLLVLLRMSSRQTGEAIALLLVLLIAFLASLYFFGAFGMSKPKVIFPNPVVLDEQSFSEGLAQINCVIESPTQLSILGVHTSCGCIWTEDPPLVVHPGERKTIRFNLDRRKVRFTSNTPIDLRVGFIINGESNPLEGVVSVIPTMDFEGSHRQ